MNWWKAFLKSANRKSETRKWWDERKNVYFHPLRNFWDLEAKRGKSPKNLTLFSLGSPKLVLRFEEKHKISDQYLIIFQHSTENIHFQSNCNILVLTRVCCSLRRVSWNKTCVAESWENSLVSLFDFWPFHDEIREVALVKSVNDFITSHYRDWKQIPAHVYTRLLPRQFY